MFTASNLIFGCCLVASGLVGWWIVPVFVAAGLFGDLAGRTRQDDE